MSSVVTINARDVEFQVLNEKVVQKAGENLRLENVLGQRFLAAGRDKGNIEIQGTPGNALGAYLNGANLTVRGNAQDATGDTMNAGTVVIHGSSGDATGYAMRGGEIFVKGRVGHRAGIHMKAYKDNVPHLVIGGRAGSFLGEYQAGGVIVLLGLGNEDVFPVGYYCGTGMHGGKIFIRTAQPPVGLPPHVRFRAADAADSALIRPLVSRWCALFSVPEETVYTQPFQVLEPDTEGADAQHYIANN
ncbi:MAG: glutamate synthase [Oscillospiraceae bacterium]|jgi:glutamate synthase domain-containing protein 3|nr:glutamate synthase [Oscillospiraceae bacterium]